MFKRLEEPRTWIRAFAIKASDGLRPIVIGAVGILFGLLSCGTVASQEVSNVEPDSSEALADAQSAWKRFREVFKLTYAEVRNSWPDAETKSQTLQNKLTIKIDNARYVGIVETLSGDQWEGEAYGKNDRYRFQIRRHARERPWVIVRLTREPGDDPEALWIPQFASYPLGVNSIALDELARNPVFHVAGIQKDSTGLVDVTFRISDPQVRMSDGQRIGFSGGRVTLDPSRCWLPVRKKLMWGSGRALGGEVTVFQTEAGISYPMNFVGHDLSEDGRFGDVKGTVTIEKLQLGRSFPYREFTLSAFGLPEPAGSRGIPGYVWLAVIALVALAVGGVLRSRARR